MVLHCGHFRAILLATEELAGKLVFTTRSPCRPGNHSHNPHPVFGTALGHSNGSSYSPSGKVLLRMALPLRDHAPFHRLSRLARTLRKGKNHRKSIQGSQRIKYYILLVLLAPAAGALSVTIADSSEQNSLIIAGFLCILAIAAAVSRKASPLTRRTVAVFMGLAVFWAAAGYFPKLDGAFSASLMTGLLN